MTDVKVVAPMNMGKGIVWNEQTKQYEVNLGDGLVFNKQGKIELLPITPKTTFDNGTGQGVKDLTIIDYGNGIVEINGVVGITTTPPTQSGSGYVSMEGSATINLQEFNFQKIINVQATAVHQRSTGAAKENAWIIGNNSWEPISMISTDHVKLGAQIVGNPNVSVIPIMFQIKGLKA